MTSACHTCRDLIGGYVLDALDADERALVHDHIQSCESCAREHAELATIPVLLDAAESADAVPLRPPARLEEAVLDRFARERRGTAATRAAEPGDAAPSRSRRPAWRRWLIPVTAALACAIVAGGAMLVLTGDDPSTEPPAAQQSRVYEVAMTGTGPLRQASGEARLYPGATGTGVHLTVTGLDPRAYDYELWCVRDDGWKMSAGTFRADENGHADIELTTAAKPSEYDALTIQARPAGAGDRADGPRVLVGRIRS